MNRERYAETSALDNLSEGEPFRVRLSTPKSSPRPKLKSFIGRIKALSQAHTIGRQRLARGGRGGGAAARIRSRASPQRVAIKTRVINHRRYRGKGGASAAIADEIAYLRRRGASEDGEIGVAFDAGGTLSGEELQAFRKRMATDRHHFRLVVSPEYGAALDLPEFTREFMTEVERDLSSRLQWFGVAHYDTDNPHVHLIVRGQDAHHRDLVINRDYISHGMRLQAGEVATRHLGPRKIEDIERSLKADLKAERVTTLDRVINQQAIGHPDGLVSVLHRPDGNPAGEHERIRRLARLQHLESLGLAREIRAGVWQPDANLLEKLKALSIRNDVVKTIHATEAKHPVGLDPIILSAQHPPKEAVIGRVLHRARVNEVFEDEYLLIDSERGRTLYLLLADARAQGDLKVGAIVKVSAGEGGAGTPALDIRALAPSLTAEIEVNGVSALDRPLLERGMPKAAPITARGFERDYPEALRQRAAYLQSIGLAELQGTAWRAHAGLLDELYQREITAAAARLTPKYGDLKTLSAGERWEGTVRSMEDLPSGPHAVIEAHGRLALVPATADLTKMLNQRVSLHLRGPSLPGQTRSMHIHVLRRSRGIGGPT
jgi:type IV secretory pathway VirD2 relaxase